MDIEIENKNTTSWLDRPLSFIRPYLTIENLLAITILIAAIITRFYDVDLRVMSHDETNHVVPSYDLFMGRGYRHDPVTHGPLQFHMLALSYFLLGDNDFSSRVPAVLFSIANVGFVLFAFRRYLGRSGSLIAGFLFLISPYLLFYGRYTRNEAFIGLFGVMLIYAVFRYLDKGDKPALFVLTLATVLHFMVKETSYIYTAQLLLFLGFIFLDGLLRNRHWQDEGTRRRFSLGIFILILFALALVGFAVYKTPVAAPPTTTETAPAVAPTAFANLPQWQIIGLATSGIGFLIALVFSFITVTRNLGWKEIRSLRSFDMLILIGTLILPLLSAFPVRIIGWDPLDYSTTGILHTGISILLFVIISVAIGLWWNPRLWLQNAALFYVIFIVFYTTFFTNGRGFFTGLIGSLGYWLSQQGVQRGSQPIYYYALIQIPIYEYLAALGTLLALYFGLRNHRFSTLPGISPADAGNDIDYSLPEQPLQEESETVLSVEDGSCQPAENLVPVRKLPVLSFILFWAVTSLLAFSVAGEKMPWLTVHPTIPLLLGAGWGLGYLVDSSPWKSFSSIRAVIALLLLPVVIMSAATLFGTVLGNQPPFQGKTLEQLEATNAFLLSLVTTVAALGGIYWLLRGWLLKDIIRLATVTLFVLLAILTARTAFRASYVNYDYATEFLVYAHAARGPKDVLAQIEDISRRMTGGKDIVVAYDNDGLYPYWWYLRDYPNHRWFTDKPTRDLRDASLIIASETNYGKLESIVKDDFIYFDYMRLWWPNQDYFNLTWDRVSNAITNPEMRTALFNIWMNRDYTAYAALTNNQNLKLETWQPSSRMRLYIRKDVVSKIWSYGTVPAVAQTVKEDPYEAKMVRLNPDLTIGVPGTAEGQFQKPRGIAIAPDGSIYVADAGNNRIQVFSAEGKFKSAWGTFGDSNKGQVEGGAFNEPWGIAIGNDGSVFVTDTWNHRIQKFSAEGKFIKTWGFFGQGESPEAFWGPRGLTIDSEGRLYVSDTGNKRIVVFTQEGDYVAQFGSAGVDPGQFDEPVGIAIDAQNVLYVADTWNQRIQAFQTDAKAALYPPLRNWEINAWFGQSLENKPFLTLDNKGNVIVTDPDGYRVLVFQPDGTFIRGWGDYSSGTDGFGLPAAAAVDKQNRVWVSDAGNNLLLRFTMPD